MNAIVEIAIIHRGRGIIGDDRSFVKGINVEMIDDLAAHAMDSFGIIGGDRIISRIEVVEGAFIAEQDIGCGDAFDMRVRMGVMD